MNDAFISAELQRPFGATGLRVPPVMFGAGVLGNARRVLPEQTRLEICAEWLKHVAPPLLLHVHGGREVVERSLEILRQALSRFEVTPDEVIISLSLPPPDAVEQHHSLDLWHTARRLLGAHRPRLIALELPSTAGEPSGRRANTVHQKHVAQALLALADLKSRGEVAGVGLIGADWRLARDVVARVELDWLMLLGSYSVLHHPPELVEFMEALHKHNTPMVVGEACGDFLLGGSRSSARSVDPLDPADQSLLAWRRAFVSLCHGHGMTPAQVCVQFALQGPGVAAVCLETEDAESVAEESATVITPVPEAFWQSLVEEGLLPD